MHFVLLATKVKSEVLVVLYNVTSVCTATIKSRDRLLSLQVFVTWSVKLLPVNSLQFLLSFVRKRSYCRWCPQVLSWELCRDIFSWHSTVI